MKMLAAGIVTGAADDDPSAIGTYASAGARYGLAFLWIAPVLLPMMYVVVYLSAKIGQVYGKGLFACIRDQFPRWLLLPLVTLAFAGNIIEAAADLGGIGAALNLLVPIPVPLIVVGAAAIIFALQYFGSYMLIRRVFRWLALILFAYVAAAVMARPDPIAVLRATFIPALRIDAQSLSLIVACIGTSLSAYIYTWQSNQEVEEQIALGRRRLWQRKGATASEMKRTSRDVLTGMIFSNLILYFILLATGITLHAAGRTEIETAADAAAALEPIAGQAAKFLFAAGVVGVGFLAVPVMTTGAAYDVVQGLGRAGSLHDAPQDNRLFYAIIAAVTALAVAMNFLGFNPMKALVWSGIVQGFSVPPLLLLMMLLTNRPAVVGARTNGRWTNLLGWTTTGVTFLCALSLAASWLL
ncbi:divalent metal cation transporter [Sphingobium fuliginis]|jgi:Mn2+/Fe2+ NRAMP family transporter|uniref:Divalent metal cation transporter n=2 Tax=Sphingobium TaxID=165695 RepID=A0A7M2GCA7_SPHSA|nr:MULTISPECIES: divalent metal cation transporter [Sphingobium]MCB4859472.1 divalent metal cation transporter [Sphingobium sp. PNB]QOT70228.1 divalent metal cation transporter [Sphingobium fuliginis]